MASIKQTTDKAGNTVFKVTVSNGRGRRITRSWKPSPSWSAKTVQRELQRFSADLENQLAGGELQTWQEKVEQERLERLQAEANPTLHSISTIFSCR